REMSAYSFSTMALKIMMRNSKYWSALSTAKSQGVANAKNFATCVDARISREFFWVFLARSGSDMCPACNAAFQLPLARMVFEGRVQIKPTCSKALCRKLVFPTPSHDCCAKLPKTSLAPPPPQSLALLCLSNRSLVCLIA
ncbi:MULTISPECIES: hypothetical protein, partial [unclassified Labrenzia]|uniref:hypothetical protein n=1 Tax=unclassified Labrenzia TaxID=2648686 RepID=UPI001AD9098E